MSTFASDRSMEVWIPYPLGNYGRPTNKPKLMRVHKLVMYSSNNIFTGKNGIILHILFYVFSQRRLWLYLWPKESPQARTVSTDRFWNMHLSTSLCMYRSIVLSNYLLSIILLSASLPVSKWTCMLYLFFYMFIYLSTYICI